MTATSLINSILNGRPITKLTDDPEDFRVLTPAQLLGGGFEESANPMELLNAAGYRKSFKILQEAVQGWWVQWSKQYLHSLQDRQRWFNKGRSLKKGDLILMVEPGLPRGSWRRGLVIETYPDRWGVVRKVQLKTMNGALFMRDIRKIVLLEGTTE